jgi:hypothetical protein
MSFRLKVLARQHRIAHLWALIGLASKGSNRRGPLHADTSDD